MSPAPLEPPAAFSMHVGNGLYLDNDNHFLPAPLADAPVYEIGGGMLSLGVATRDGILSGTLAVLPLKNEPGWAGTARDLGFGDEEIKLFGKAASLASNIVMVVGWVQAAIKIAEMVGIFKKTKSVEQLAQEILTKLGVVQDMVAEADEHAVKLAIETAGTDIGALRNQVVNDLDLLQNENLSERRARRKGMLDKADLAEPKVGEILATSRWRLFNQGKQYVGTWGFFAPSSGTYELQNPPWWGAPRYVPRKQLGADGISWIDAAYPTAYKQRPDYRAALPFALQGVYSYLAMLTMAEPEFRSTMHRRDSILAIAGILDTLLQEMRSGFVRSSYEAGDFKFAGAADEVLRVDLDGPLGPAPPVWVFRRPHFQWQVGAINLCADTDSHFSELAGSRPATSPWTFDPAPYKLGTLDFDWLPPAPKMILVPGLTTFPSATGPGIQGPPHWEITNAQECADAANRQSEADFAVSLQASGYFQLAQLQATLRHLATDPDRSETVTGVVRRRRKKIASREVTVSGHAGLICDPVIAVGTREQYRSHAVVSLELQRPDRFNAIPTRIYLVALTAPSDSSYPGVLSEIELQPGTHDLTLPVADTFDWYVEKKSVGGRLIRPSTTQLAHMAVRTKRLFAYASPTEDIRRRSLVVFPEIDTHDEVPEGEQRNFRQEPVTLTSKLTRSSTDTTTGATVEVTSGAQTRNARYVYVAVEETFGSGGTLRTYYDLRVNTQLTLLPKEFFDQERQCLKDSAELIDYINDHFSESVPVSPIPEPIRVDALVAYVETLRAAVPEIVERASAALVDREPHNGESQLNSETRGRGSRR